MLKHIQVYCLYSVSRSQYITKNEINDNIIPYKYLDLLSLFRLYLQRRNLFAVHDLT